MIPAGVLPEGSGLDLKTFSADYAGEKILALVNADAAKGEELFLAAMQTVDIGFVTEAGAPISPNSAAPISVTLASDTIAAMTEPRLFRFVNGGVEEAEGFEINEATGNLSLAQSTFSPLAVAELTTKQPAEEPEENPAEEPAQVRTLTAELDGVEVLAEVPEGVLPETAQLHLEYYNKEAAATVILSVLDETSGEETDPESTDADADADADAAAPSILAVDISFVDGDAPAVLNGTDAIRVTVTADAIIGMTAPHLFHLTDTGAEEMTDAAFDVEAGTLVFESDTFSPFVIVDLNKPETVETAEAEPETPAVKLMERTGVRRMLFIHHDPHCTDRILRQREAELKSDRVSYAREGQIIIL